MARNIAVILSLIIFAFGILGASVLRTSAQSSKNYKLTPLIQNIEENQEKIKGETISENKREVDYDLHWGGTLYPGILPDHFFYPLKMIRDRIWLWLTTNPLKKGELLLKFADKRLMAAEALIEKNKIDLSITTLTKAEKYLERAINQERVAKNAGAGTNDFLDLLSRACLKHEEVILGFEEKVSETYRPNYENILHYSREGYRRVKERMEE